MAAGIIPRGRKKDLWSGTWTTGSISLSEDYTNYDIVAIISQTNTQQFCDFFIVGFEKIVAYITCSHSSDPIATGFSYNAMMNIELTNGTTMTMIMNSAHNPNWTLKVKSIVGIKL